MPIKDKTGIGDRIGTSLEKKLEQFIPPFQRFTHNQTTGSMLRAAGCGLLERFRLHLQVDAIGVAAVTCIEGGQVLVG
jgi:hypothetical protein